MKEMMNILIWYPKCSTCRNAKKFLDENKISYVERNIVTDTPTTKELESIIEKSGLPVSKFFNTSGLLYRNMDLKTKLKQLSDEEKIKLLSSNGMLIKRPLLIVQKTVMVGYKKDEWDKLK